LESYSFVQTIRGSFVQQIEPAKDAVRVEEGVELFSTAFEQVCAFKVVDKFMVIGLTMSWRQVKRRPRWRGRMGLPKATFWSDYRGHA
jgi:hypothetical protein